MIFYDIWYTFMIYDIFLLGICIIRMLVITKKRNCRWHFKIQIMKNVGALSQFTDIKPTPPTPPHQKWPYIHETCIMCWNEWKINFPIFSFFLRFFMYRRFCASSIKTGSKLKEGWGVCISLVGKYPVSFLLIWPLFNDNYFFWSFLVGDTHGN